MKRNKLTGSSHENNLEEKVMLAAGVAAATEVAEATPSEAATTGLSDSGTQVSQANATEAASFVGGEGASTTADATESGSRESSGLNYNEDIPENTGITYADAAEDSGSIDSPVAQTSQANEATDAPTLAPGGVGRTTADATSAGSLESSGLNFNEDIPDNTEFTYTGSVDINPNFIANGEAVSNGIDGTGVNVGIVSDSFDAPGGPGSYLTDVITGDLPPDVNILNDAAGTDEGRAMAQIVSDVAPGADLTFHSAFNNGGAIGASNAVAIDNLVESGVDIIADDTTNLAAPVYQRGPQAQATDRAADAGVTVFTSAGNQGDNAIETTTDYEEDTILAGAPVFNYQPGETIRTTLHWDDPYQTISAEGNVPTADFDLGFYQVEETDDGLQFVFDDDGNFVPVNFGPDASGEDQILLSDQRQLTDGTDPFEFVSGTNNTGEAILGGWGTTLIDGDGEDRTTRLTFWEGPSSVLADDSPLSGPALAENGIQVGAVNINNSQVQSFSSAGPGTLLFDDQGNRLPGGGQEVDVDIAAPDGVNTTFFGTDVANDPDAFPNFFGTSAAAPVAAGAGAILLDEAGDAVADADRPELLANVLADSATPVGNADQTGAGLINVQAARAELQRQIGSASSNAEIDELNLLDAELLRGEADAEREAVEQQRQQLT